MADTAALIKRTLADALNFVTSAEPTVDRNRDEWAKLLRTRLREAHALVDTLGQPKAAALPERPKCWCCKQPYLDQHHVCENLSCTQCPYYGRRWPEGTQFPELGAETGAEATRTCQRCGYVGQWHEVASYQHGPDHAEEVFCNDAAACVVRQYRLDDTRFVIIWTRDGDTPPYKRMRVTEAEFAAMYPTGDNRSKYGWHWVRESDLPQESEIPV